MSNRTGTQNYTCNATIGTYSTTGTAEAELFDVTQFYTGDNKTIVSVPIISDLQPVGSHLFVPSPLAPGSAAPKFENAHNFVIGAKNNSVPSVPPNFSVTSVLLKNIQPGKAGGSLANWVVRTNAIGGVVPPELNKCTAGDTIAIPYKANYLFFAD